MNTKTEADQTSETEDAFARDLALAQTEMENAAYNSVNPHFKSRYADFASVREATRPLNKYFSIDTTMRIEYTPTGELLRVGIMEFTHFKSGKKKKSEWLIEGSNEQQRGSSNTYNKRYALSNFANIASEDDDDANEAMSAGVKQKSAYQARADKDYETLVAEMHKCETRNDLFKWRKEIMPRRAALPDSWRDLLDEQCEMHRLNMIQIDEGAK